MPENIALAGAPCEADGHPSECTEPATGTVESTDESLLSVEGVDVGTHGTAVLHFPSHAHDYNEEDGCIALQSHDLTPDQEHLLTINGASVMLDGDSTTDPGSGGTAEIIDHGGNEVLTVG
ncbi:hypothetical protein ChaoS9_130 [Halobacterium phage ChaoS9]|uniref:Uncharacterized protein n=1 Tax=Halobacterium phage ChaoS9 TaxID=2847105 RepID=A0A481V9F1_9CAUD|nr:hypothetical protein KMC41_gp27 [Halobacterium phage ChaoS9]QBI90033.1 hypothetical protein ChaoS9_130 [Halobacterium phage ChaoS9]